MVEEIKQQQQVEDQDDRVLTKMDVFEAEEQSVINVPQKEQASCRFCWDSETSEINPLLSSCKCRGGVQFIHYFCLKEWLKTKRQTKESPNLKTYYWKNFECEICKTPYPYLFKAGGFKYNLVDIQKPDEDFIILESLNLEKNMTRMIHVLSPCDLQTDFKIGRGHDSDLRINDISVSRCHAVIKFKNDNFYLQDNMSKFGTLVLIRKKLLILPKT